MPRERPAPRRWGRLAFQLAGVLYRREAARSASDFEHSAESSDFKRRATHRVQSSRLASLFAACYADKPGETSLKCLNVSPLMLP